MCLFNWSATNEAALNIVNLIFFLNIVGILQLCQSCNMMVLHSTTRIFYLYFMLYISVCQVDY